MMSLADRSTRCGFRCAGHGGRPGHHLHDLVERRAVLIGTGQKSPCVGDNQMRIFSPQFVRAELLLVPIVRRGKFSRNTSALPTAGPWFAVLGVREIENDAALAAIEQREERSAHAAEATVLSPAGGSTLMTSAPAAPGSCRRSEPITIWVHLDDLTPASGNPVPVIVVSVFFSRRPGLTLGAHAPSEKYNLTNGCVLCSRTAMPVAFANS